MDSHQRFEPLVPDQWGFGMELNAVAMAAKLTARLVVLLLLAVGLRVNQAPTTNDGPAVPSPIVAFDDAAPITD